MNFIAATVELRDFITDPINAYGLDYCGANACVPSNGSTSEVRFRVLCYDRSGAKLDSFKAWKPGTRALITGNIVFSDDTTKPLDLIVTTGGASVGDHDYVAKDINKSTNSELYFWKIAMRPGKPLMFGQYKNIPFLGLPGNPVSAGVCAVLFLEPIIKKFLGQDPALVFSSAITTKTLAENDRREEYLRATLSIDEKGSKQVTAASKQDSSMLATLASADCLIQRPAHSPSIETGDPVPILNFPDLF